MPSSAAARRVVMSFAESGGVGMRARSNANAGIGSFLGDRMKSVSASFGTSSPTSDAAGLGPTAPVSASAPSTSSTPSNKGIFAKMWDRYSLGEQQKRIMLGENLFRSAQRRSSDLTWYTAGHLGRDFRPRHALLTMHVWFLHRRLLADKIDPHKSLMIQEELFDVLWNDSRSRIRAEGVNELTVNKHLKDVQQVSFQQMTHFDHAFTEFKDDSVKRFDELALAVWSHLLMKDENASNDLIKRLAAYVEYQHQNVVQSLPDAYFQEGMINWGRMPDFAGLKENDGKAMLPIAPHPDDVLPDNWAIALTDAGDAYYWNTETNRTTWQRPV